MKINFKNFKIPLGISKINYKVGDVRENFADLLYTQVNGIRAHTLAIKIFKSEGAEEYSDEEVAFIRKVAADYCIPAFIDGLEEQINEAKSINTNTQ